MSEIEILIDHSLMATAEEVIETPIEIVGAVEESPIVKPTRKRRWSPRSCKHIIVLGAGGVGFYLTIGLMADNLPQTVTVYDADNFIGGNGHRRLPRVVNTNTPKVTMLQAACHMTFGYEIPQAFARHFTVEDAKKLNSTYLVVDATDMGFATRTAIWEAFTKTGAKGVRVSYDGNGIVCLAYGPPFSPPDDQGGYDRMPSTAQSFLAGGAGCQFIKALLNGLEPEEMQIEIPDALPMNLEASRPALEEEEINA